MRSISAGYRSAAILLSLLLASGPTALATEPDHAPEVLEIINSYAITGDALANLLTLLPSEPVVIDAPYNHQTAPATAIKVNAFDIATGVLNSVIDPTQIDSWTDFSLLGGTVMIVIHENGDTPSLVAMLPSESVGPFTAVVSKSDIYFEDWFQEMLQSIIDGLNWVDDPDSTGQDPGTEPPAEDEEPEDSEEDPEEDPGTNPDPSETW